MKHYTEFRVTLQISGFWSVEVVARTNTGVT